MNTPAGLTPQQEEWLATRKHEALNVDPETAELAWEYGNPQDPYGVNSLPEEYEQVSEVLFARRPGSDIWVEFGDLPGETLKRVRNRIASGELLRKPSLCQNILAEIHDKPPDLQLSGLLQAIINLLMDAPLSRERRAIRVRWIAESLINRMACIDRKIDIIHAEEVTFRSIFGGGKRYEVEYTLDLETASGSPLANFRVHRASLG